MTNGKPIIPPRRRRKIKVGWSLSPDLVEAIRQCAEDHEIKQIDFVEENLRAALVKLGYLGKVPTSQKTKK